jgi:hypothetical protein
MVRQAYRSERKQRIGSYSATRSLHWLFWSGDADVEGQSTMVSVP